MDQIITDVTAQIDNSLQTAFEAVKRSMIARTLPGQNRYVVYIDHALLEQVPDEVVATQVNDPKLKINQFKAHLTKDVKPFNARAFNIDKGRVQSAVLTLEIHSVSNIETVRTRTEKPVIVCSWGEPDAQKRKDARNEKAADAKVGPYGIPSEWNAAMEAAGMPLKI